MQWHHFLMHFSCCYSISQQQNIGDGQIMRTQKLCNLNPSGIRTVYSKNGRSQVSGSLQNKHVRSSTLCLLTQVSLVRIFLWAKIQRKNWISSGTLIFHIEWTWTGTIPLKLFTVYMDFTLKIPFDSNFQSKASFHQNNVFFKQFPRSHTTESWFCDENIF
jgi:hypothetical protein